MCCSVLCPYHAECTDSCRGWVNLMGGIPGTVVFESDPYNLS